MVDKLFNNNIRVLYSIARSYIKGMNEWFWSYMIAIYLTVLFTLILFSLIFFGSSFMVDFYIEIFAILVGIHVYMGFVAILHDYVYNRYVVKMCTSMLFVIVLAVLVEILKN